MHTEGGSRGGLVYRWLPVIHEERARSLALWGPRRTGAHTIRQSRGVQSRAGRAAASLLSERRQPGDKAWVGGWPFPGLPSLDGWSWGILTRWEILRAGGHVLPCCVFSARCGLCIWPLGRLAQPWHSGGVRPRLGDTSPAQGIHRTRAAFVILFLFSWKVKTCRICTCCGKSGLEGTKKNKEIDTKHQVWSCSPEPRVVTCPVPQLGGRPSLQTWPPLSRLQDICSVVPEPCSLSVPEPMGPCKGGRQLGLGQPPLTSFTGPLGSPVEKPPVPCPISSTTASSQPVWAVRNPAWPSRMRLSTQLVM